MMTPAGGGVAGDGNDTLVGRYGRHVAVDAQPTAILWLGDTLLATLGDGTVRQLDGGGDMAAWTAHDGAILSACRHPDGRSIVTGGDDGHVRRVGLDGRVDGLGHFPRRWVEHLVASATSGLIVAGAGREAVVWLAGGTAPAHRYTIGSSIGGLALDGKGKRLAVAHYNGATLHYATNAASGGTALNWVGSHLTCTLSPDGRYLVTALQETGLHAWQLPGMLDMRMPGYAAKTRSFSWDRRAKWLATGGDGRAVLWPFDGKTGPMGKPPLLVAERMGAIVTRVAFHPREDLLAVGYDDGAVTLARPADDRTLDVDGRGAPITALAWNDAGTWLGWGAEDGRIGLLNMRARA
ncbi:WD40 repeat domain-containing protein [Nitrospirillum iridis]|uniref:WD40 repeat protein n=1 Tax=Nitrospirillum iridis TaxID=765888 RepID=A0A7X0B4N9_9PROT|nr:WD40 repeat domain-containing protein [Nitrospirillum iridis]MBB6254590.1 WD40 repeat protein [Nitrospirillum iridis]